MKKIPVIIDCDPGHDDMMALVIACASEKLDVKLVSTVSGNKSIDLVTKNALDILHYIGRDDIPVARGTEKPMVREKNHADLILEDLGMNIDSSQHNVHGETGLDGFVFPKDNPKKVIEMGAVEAMAKIIKESDDKVTLIATGPLTNLGILLTAYPDIKNKIEKISMMGGTSEFVFTRAGMEFNTFMDPEATKIVFESGLDIDMYGYDVTYSVLYDKNLVEKIASQNNKTSQMVASLLDTFMQRHNDSFSWLGLKDVSPIHDACAVAGVIDPSLVTLSKHLHVDVETGGRYLCGATLVDYINALGKQANANVVYRMDNERFFELMIASSAKLA